MKFRIPSLLALTSVLFLASCKTTQEAWMESVYEPSKPFRPSNSLADISIPILRAPGLDQRWGAPRIETAGSKAYRLSYADPTRPFERLVIYGYSRPIENPAEPPAESVQAMMDDELGEFQRPQSWEQTVIPLDGRSRPLRYFKESSGSGADGSYYGTEVFAVTGPDGRQGYYRLVVESVTGTVTERFAEAGF